MKAARWSIGALLVAACLAGIGWGSRAAYDPPGAGHGLLRLSWRTRAADAVVCHARTAAELEALPVHMRSPEVCETRELVYRLTVRVDEAPDTTVLLRPGGAHGDRPIFVLHETRLAAGPHRARVEFGELDRAAALRLDTTFVAVPGHIHLLTIDDAADALVLRSPTGP